MERLLGGGGTMVERCAVLLNAAAALYVAGRGWTMAEAAARAREALEDGGAARVLAELRRAAPGWRSTGGVGDGVILSGAKDRVGAGVASSVTRCVG